MKTTAATQFPGSLLLAFEKGYNAIGGVIAQDITKWSEYKLVIRQLAKPEVQKRFQTIIIDTVSIAWDLCEQYICSQNGVQKIADIPWGAGYTACKKEFETSLRQITQLGYGVVLIAHSASRIEKTAEGSEIEIISPDLPRRAAEICNGIVDIIGYIGNEYTKDGEHKRWLYTRETPTLFAGSRFKYLEPKIPFGYQELVDAISEAIEKAEKIDGATIVDHREETVVEQLDFKTVRKEAETLWTKIIKYDSDNIKTLNKKIEIIFGHPMKLSEVTEDQVDLLNLMNLEMQDILKLYE